MSRCIWQQSRAMTIGHPRGDDVQAVIVAHMAVLDAGNHKGLFGSKNQLEYIELGFQFQLYWTWNSPMILILAFGLQGNCKMELQLYQILFRCIL